MVSGPLAPGMLAVINGSNLGVAGFPKSCTNPVPTSCDGVSVLFNGAPAPILYDSVNTISFQVPFTATTGSATLQVSSNLTGATLSSALVSVPVAATAPGLLTTANGTGVYFVSGGLVIQSSGPVQAGEVVTMYGTGFGVTSPAVASGVLGPNTPAGAVAQATMTINSQSVPVTFAGLEPGNASNATVGYDEVIFTVPAGLLPANLSQASLPVVVTVGGVASNSVNLTVTATPPTVTSLTPSIVPLLANAQTVFVNGTGFQSGASVVLYNPAGQQINLSAPNVTFVSSTQLSVQMTVGTTAGSWSVAVLNPNGSESSNYLFLASGTGPTPVITSVLTTYGNEASSAHQIAQNAWIEVHGANLSQVTTTWSTLPASAFTNSLPTTLGNVSATVDGKSAAVYYVSPTQINILAPLDSATGSVPVQVNTPYGPTAVFSVTEQATSPTFLVNDTAGHVAAQHINGGIYSLLGPASLSAPGYTFTPAAPGEQVVLYATGFGQTNPAIANQATGTGSLPSLPSVTIGNVPAFVSFAGLSAAGLYQFNVTVPTGLPAGDATLSATYNGSTTQASVVITIGQ